VAGNGPAVSLDIIGYNILMPRRNPFDNPDAKKWLADVEQDMLPKLEGSAFMMAVFDGKVTAEFAVQIGAAIMLDKPIVLLALEGASISPKLEQVADAIVRGDPKLDPVKKRLTEAIQLALLKRGIST
jgi:hypothetical protein